MWEGIGLLLIYLVSGYLNKRKKEQQSSISEQEQEKSKELVEDKGIDELLLNLFSDKNSSSMIESDLIEDGEFDDETFIKDQDKIEKSEENPPVEDKKDFKEQVYHSKLANRKEQQLGNKWNKKEDLKRKFFKSPEMLKKAFILKEILDDPVGLKK
tara:strand:+ start:2393 stop:2860 length:468 start_codon:yes stop_codon:yes gene_type:complete